eukprot:1157753-Amphidinium_carterae.1
MASLLNNIARAENVLHMKGRVGSSCCSIRQPNASIQQYCQMGGHCNEVQLGPCPCETTDQVYNQCAIGSIPIIEWTFMLSDAGRHSVILAMCFFKPNAINAKP